MLLAGALLLATLATSTAQTTAANDVSALLSDVGLFGDWAVDCKAEPSVENPRVTVSEPEPGHVVERHDLGARYGTNTYSVLDARRVAATRIAIEVLFQPGSEAEQKQELVLSVRDRTRRTVFAQIAGGAVRVKDGVVVGYGRQTPRLRKCE